MWYSEWGLVCRDFGWIDRTAIGWQSGVFGTWLKWGRSREFVWKSPRDVVWRIYIYVEGYVVMKVAGQHVVDTARSDFRHPPRHSIYTERCGESFRGFYKTGGFRDWRR